MAEGFIPCWGLRLKVGTKPIFPGVVRTLPLGTSVFWGLSCVTVSVPAQRVTVRHKSKLRTGAAVFLFS